MGMFDWYGKIQLKTGPCKLINYKVGDKVEMPDGVYLAQDGVVIILDHKLAATFKHLVDKWGGKIDPEEVISPGISRLRQIYEEERSKDE